MIQDDVITDIVLRDDESQLQAAVDKYERVSLEIQPSVATEETITPYVWVHGPPASIDAVVSSFNAESTIKSQSCLNSSDRNDQRLYRIKWTDERSVLSQLSEHNGVILSASLNAEGWDLQLQFPSHADLSEAYEAWETDQWKIYVNRVIPCNEELMAIHGLTDEQYRAVKRAIEMGYYQVPRQTTLEELADDLDISHQALSERLRRANRNLITNIVCSFDTSEEQLTETATPAFEE